MASHPNLAHLDDGAWVRTDKGPLQGERRRLGTLVATEDVGLSQYRLGPGERIMPVHVHADEEEHFYVLSGDGFSYQDGQAFPIRAGDLIVHLGNAEAHSVIAGEQGIEYLAFGTGSETNITYLPRAGAWWHGPRWLPHDGPNPFKAEVLAGPLELPEPTPERPATIVNQDAVTGDRYEQPGYRGTDWNLARAAGSVKAGLRIYAIDAGEHSCPAHWHSGEEELFLVLAGTGTLILGDDELPVGPGHLVARPPGTGVAHDFVAGEDGLTLLGYGTRVRNEVSYFPKTGKLTIGPGIQVKVVEVDYWDDE